MVRFVTIVLLLAGCAHTLIPGTNVEDSHDNREVLAVLSELQKALQERNTEAMLGLISTRYFEDMGTPTQEDDYGYDQLRRDILPKSMGVTKEMYLSFDVHDIVVDGDLAHADLRYSSRARIDLPAGTLWDSHREFNRVELAREAGSWRIISGL
jgi:hypothetical protein